MVKNVSKTSVDPKREKKTNIWLVNKIVPLKSPAASPYKRFAVMYVTTTTPSPERADAERAASSETPHPLKASAVSQMKSGGFSNQGDPFQYKVSQWPFAACFATSPYIASSKYSGDAPNRQDSTTAGTKSQASLGSRNILPSTYFTDAGKSDSRSHF
jgi:hypothetical protein